MAVSCSKLPASMKKRLLVLLASLVSTLNALAQPCDLCNVTAALRDPETAFGQFTTGAQLVYDYKNKLLNNGDSVSNTNKDKTAITTINLYAAMGLAQNLALDFNLPVISREVGTGTFENRRTNRETGFGDLSLLLRGSPVVIKNSEGEFRWGLRGGVKLATGNSSDLSMESNQQDLNQIVRGRDLARGSGSTDVVFGTNLFSRNGRVFGYFDAQYWLKTEGDHNYQYGDALTLVGGPGFRAVDQGKKRVDLSADVIYRYLQKDSLNGNDLANSGSQTLLVGPAASFNLGDHFQARLSYSLPVYRDTNGLQLATNYLLQASAMVRF